MTAWVDDGSGCHPLDDDHGHEPSYAAIYARAVIRATCWAAGAAVGVTVLALALSLDNLRRIKKEFR